ncbi:hypothetical protein FZEAL_6542 [Fusarium zealandicum]|uniref:Uncharacterized protein n=1 Tax=Fusarium zealandicum TaxID=1053134 RepID=A0A8H4UID7_9HYPO|nr:hypothetical protein FZEAL_6542 [Fusarium zealandicum]
MNLGAKVKELLHSGDSKDASKGDVDRNTPGSFPVDDMRGTESQDSTTAGHGHNKLHKSNDPRARTEGDELSRGHGQQDSGVGLLDSGDTTRNNPPQDLASEKHREPLDRSAEPLDRSAEPLDRSTEPVAGSGLGDNTRLPSQEATSDLAPTSQEHPYWGDLPRGQGVHNTVTGHGSHEDDAMRQRGIHSGEHQTNPASASSHPGSGAPLGAQGQDLSSQPTDLSSTQRDTQGLPQDQTSGSRFTEGLGGAAAAGTAGAGAYGLGKEHGADQSLPQSQQGSGIPTTAPGQGLSSQSTDPYDSQRSAAPSHHTGGAGTTLPGQNLSSQTTDPYSSQAHTQQHPDERTTGSHLNEGLAGAAVASTAGAGAYGLNKKHHADDTPSNVDDASRSTQHEDKHGRSFPLLQRDQKDTHETKEVKEDKHHKEHKPEHESKLGGLFHRSGHKDDTEHKTEDDLAKDKHHGSKAAPAMAAAGAGSAATYAATRDRHDDGRAQDPSTTGTYQDSTAPRGTDQYSSSGLPAAGAGGVAAHGAGDRHDATRAHDPATTGIYQDSTPSNTAGTYQDTTSPRGNDQHSGAGLATAAGAGGAAAYAATRHGHDDRSAQDAAAPSRGIDQYSGAGHDSSRGLDTQSRQPVDQFSTDPSTQSYQQQQQGTHRDGNLASGAAGAAGGLGAGALASHALGQGHGNTHDVTQDNRQGLQSGEPGLATTVGNTMGSGHDTSRTENLTGSDDRTQRSTEATPPSITQKANQGQYNTLASGTPSGVRVEDRVDSTRSDQRDLTDSSANKDRHHGAGVAGLGAVAGAGTAAAMSGRDHDKRDEPIEREQTTAPRTERDTDRPMDRQLDSQKPTAAGLGSSMGSNQPMIHNCQKCGEANDISKYFTSNAPGKI